MSSLDNEQHNFENKDLENDGLKSQLVENIIK
jgi:hypothetical protein